MLRSLAERFSRGVVLKRRLPARFQRLPIYVTPEASLRYWGWNLERVDRMLLGLAEELVAEGDTVWDVGANVGLFSFAAAALAGPSGRVLAVEPDTFLVELLRRSARVASPERAPVDILAVALDETPGIARLNIAQRARSANYLQTGRTEMSGGVRETQLVTAVSLDWLLERYPAPRLVKIDVEGAEAQVLSGAGRLLAEARPVILCEVYPDNAARVASLLHAHGYGLRDAQTEKSKRAPLASAAYLTLAVPPVA